MFQQELIPRKIGLKPSIKVREAFPEDKVYQQCDCRDFLYLPMTGLNAGPQRSEDNRSDHAWTDLCFLSHTRLVSRSRASPK